MATIFVAGIIQGSIQDSAIHSQSYRDRIVGLLRSALPDVEIYCPIENYPNSLEFSEPHARRTFFGLMERAGEADVLVAYVPEASMGTAIEMWRAHSRGRVVLTISPMGANWTIRFLSTVLLPDIGAFEHYVESGELARLLASRGIIARDGRGSQTGGHP
jgi:hypothetical protein